MQHYLVFYSVNRGKLDLSYGAGVFVRPPRNRQIYIRVLLVYHCVGCGGWRGSLRTSAFDYVACGGTMEEDR